MNDSKTKPEDLIDLLSQAEDPTGRVVNELLSHFARGYPIAKLRLLMHSNDMRLRRHAVWIASELGSNAKPLLPDIAWVLRSLDSRTRFFAIDVVLSCAGRDDGSLIVKVINFLTDQEPSIRWKAIQFVFRALSQQLLGAIDVLPKDSVHIEPLSMIANVPSEAEGASAVRGATAALQAWTKSALHDELSLRRRYGVAAAMRLGASGDRAVLRLASESQGEEISRIAMEFLFYRAEGLAPQRTPI